MSARGLKQLADELGILTYYRSLSGERINARPEAIAHVVRSLGHGLREDLSNSSEMAIEVAVERAARMVEPVVVQWLGEKPCVPVILPRKRPPGKIFLDVELEEGGSRAFSFKTEKLKSIEKISAGGDEYRRYLLPLGEQLPQGYHQCRLKAEKLERPFWIFSAPASAWVPEKSHERDWGAFAPLYALKSKRNWGIGDFTDAKDLMELIGSKGGRMFATLPLLAVFLQKPFTEPSPYSPVTRLFWNELFLDPADAPEFRQAAAVQEWTGTDEFKEKLRSAKGGKSVNYDRVAELKRPVLERMAEQFFRADGESGQPFREFMKIAPDVKEYARFRATTETRNESWHSWPERLRGGRLQGGDYDEQAYRYHLYVQWLLHGQLTGLSEAARAHGDGLYLDLPTGVHSSGYDVWKSRVSFAEGVSAGAPPDPFFTLGQDWGFQPFHPERQRDDGYRYFRECIARHLHYAGVLRLDHVMQLHRLYWVPHGMGAANGIYVKYPADEFYAILALESQRHKAVVVGEDLGTVPSYVRKAMDKRRIQRMYVLQFEIPGDPRRKLKSPPKECVASINTHDMPPFAAWWNTLDPDLRLKLAVLKPEQLNPEKKYRAGQKKVLLKTLKDRKLIRGVKPGYDQVLQGTQKFLAESRAKLVLVNLEDLWAETLPQNVPGTWKEYPNWSKRLKQSVEMIGKSPEVRAVFEAVSAARSAGGRKK